MVSRDEGTIALVRRHERASKTSRANRFTSVVVIVLALILAFDLESICDSYLFPTISAKIYGSHEDRHVVLVWDARPISREHRLRVKFAAENNENSWGTRQPLDARIFHIKDLQAADSIPDA